MKASLFYRIAAIHACDEQLKAYANHQHQQCRPKGTREGIIKSLQIHAKSHIRRPISPMQASGDAVQLRTRLLQTHSIRQANKGPEPMDGRR